MVAILGTINESGLDYTTEFHLLNVMLNHHKSGLRIFGDIDVTGRVVTSYLDSKWEKLPEESI